MDYIASIGSIHRKKGFLGRGTSDWSLSFKGCVLVLDWSLLSR